ncbi:fatty-acid--CoA ligase FadD1 [Aldersonia sp. NBC_00410]|uniref:fatty-acid--CoA ligase FadD1 n=1 Tax=Aldersonia sp. NBC_00410 TaxID=2975954 RepID=UPI002250D690|nr:fatty-acid--CoA ligase FadD1 [Aldersonia sp. NBC_00410]MCX5044769.1 fatty-acid--CoA ligase FadD1 [Aldersonia sp. NBC_00410]
MADTIQQLLRERAESDSTAIIYGDRRVSWRDYIADASAEAAALIAMADKARPMHVGALLANSPDMLVAMAGAGLGGYVLCGINNTRRGENLARDIAKADCQILLVDAAHRELLEGLDLPGVTVVDVEDPQWQQSLAAAGALVPHAEASATDTYMMIFTSGTSGDPKAVRVAHLMIMFAADMLADKFGLTPDDVCYLSMPLFHSNAVVAGFGVALAAGAAMVPAKFSASAFLDDVRRYGVTYMNYVGKPLAYILATPQRPDDGGNTLRVAFGNEASDRDIAEFARRFGTYVLDGFGSTENAVIIARDSETPIGSVGKGLPDVGIYDPVTVTECATARFDEAGALANPDEAIGELVNTQGSGFFSGYYNDTAATEDRMRHGMFWSGDLAYRDAEGWIYLAGRTADWMRVDGENLAAAPIERVLQRLGALSRVAVYAVPDANVGDQVMAAIVLRDNETLTPQELTDFLAEQLDLSPKAWPRYVRIGDDLPTTATNKILKRTLASEGVTAGDGTLWVREERGTAYRAQNSDVAVATS